MKNLELWCLGLASLITATAQAQTIRVHAISHYESMLTHGVCEHYYQDKVKDDDKENLIKFLKAVRGTKFENPNMKYAKEADISKFMVTNIPLDDIVNGKITLTSEKLDFEDFEKIAGQCFAYLPDAYIESFMFTDVKNGADGLVYGNYCSNMASKSHTNRVYDPSCTSRKSAAYTNCLRSLKHSSGTQIIEDMAACQKLNDTFEDVFCDSKEVYSITRECEGSGFFISKNVHNKPVSIVPYTYVNNKARVSQNVTNVSYKNLVESLLLKYGPATLSIRRHNTTKEACSALANIHDFKNSAILEKECKESYFINFRRGDCSSLQKFYSDTYYWLAKPWVLRVQVVFPNDVEKITDTTKPDYVSTIFINWDNFKEQGKYMQK